ncbi:phage head closure protein [Scandinavium sp. H11S7]|uniref:phage head closure protein n=1 Tax=Scandinavium hiltneri TaxID=2926519 RepID=UPI00216617D6|nr:phage head closure protein [Scandinavium hiltneri]MCS2155469.1 phage head closure protein [Scandinavium hiltneri]
MEFAKLSHRITIQRRTSIQSPVTGAMEYTWSNLADVWAEVVSSSVRDFIAAQASTVKVSARIKIRYREDIQEKDRVLFRGKIYSIEGVLPDPDSGLEYLTLPCSEGVKDG